MSQTPTLPAIPGPPQPPVPAYAPAPPANGLAVASLVLGIVSLACGYCVTAIPGVVLGHVALVQIRDSAGRQGGRGLAIGGLVCGYVSIGLVVLGVLLYVLVLVILGGVGVAAASA